MAERLPLGRRLHAGGTVALAVTVAAAIAAWGVGWVEVRGPRPPSPAVAPQPATPAAPAPPARPWVREAPEARAYFELLGHEATLFRFEGAVPEVWFEVTTDGRTEELKRDLSRGARADVEGGSAGLVSSGSILWVRRRAGGEEWWDLAIGLENSAGRLVTSYRDTFAPPRPQAGIGVSGSWGRDNGYAVFGPDGVADLDGFHNPTEGKFGVARRVVLKCRFAR